MRSSGRIGSGACARSQDHDNSASLGSSQAIGNSVDDIYPPRNTSDQITCDAQYLVHVEPRSIDELLAQARSKLDRVAPSDIEAELAAGALVVDTRPAEQRERDGEMPGAIVIDRNVLEWRLDPASEHRISETRYGRRVVVVCNEGYSSSLAAATLRELGLDATDLEGGFQAWLVR
jgi:rhodanese-related sulfurtransferase